MCIILNVRTLVRSIYGDIAVLASCRACVPVVLSFRLANIFFSTGNKNNPIIYIKSKINILISIYIYIYIYIYSYVIYTLS